MSSENTHLSGNARNRRRQRRFVQLRRSGQALYVKQTGVRIPLYFGWELVFGFGQVADARQHIVGPFRTYQRFVLAVVAMIVVVAGAMFFSPDHKLFAATYTWVQNAWTGGITANIAVHPTNQTAWTQYGAKDAATTDGATVSLAPTNQSITKTSDTDFSGGTFSSTAVNGTGSASSVTISNSVIEPPVIYSYPTNRNFNDTAYDSDNHVVWAATGTGGQQLIRYPIDGGAETVINIPAISGIIISGIEYDPSRHTLWASGTGGHLYEINPNYPGTPTIVHDYTAGVLGEIALDPVNQYVYITDNWRLRRIKMDGTGAKNCFYDSAGYTEVHSVIVDPTGTYVYFTLWDVEGGVGIEVARYDAATCTTTYLSGASGISLGNNLAFDGSGNIWSTSSSGLYKINPSTLAATQYQAGSLFQGLVYDPNQGVMWSIKTTNTLVRVSTANGALVGTGVAASTAYKSIVKVPDNHTVWFGQGTNEVRVTTVGYPSSGTFTSAAIDTGGNVTLGTAAFTSTTPTGTTLTIKIRSSAQADMSDATAWGSCANIASGQAMSTGNCVTNGQRYLQYLATLGTSDSTKTSSLDDLTLGYTIYTNGTLTSSSFDTIDATNVVGKLEWTSSGTGTVRFQLRTSPDNATWTAWLGPTGAGDYYTDNTGSTAINTTNHDGVGDRYVQYKAYLISADGITTPSLTSTTVTYVVNAPPEIQASPTASQNSDGTVTIQYAIRDTDSVNDTGSVGVLTPSFEYSVDNGAHWSAITTGLPASATTPKAVDTGTPTNYTSYTTTWTPKSQIDGTYAGQAKIRVTVDDLQGANRTASDATAAFALDVKNPTPGSPAIFVDASTTPATVTLSAADDSSMQMCVTLDNSQNNCVAYATSSTIALATDPDTVYVIFKDAYGNAASANAVTPQTPNNLIIRDLSNAPTLEYQLFVTWGATSLPANQFARYEVYHSTTGVNGSYALLDTIADKTINYFFHKSLVAGSTHYYRITTVDTSGNESYLSTPINAIANGQGGGTDVVAPQISSPVISSITTQSALVTWNTDELSNSTVGYSTTAAHFETEVGVATMVDTASGAGQHRVILTGLTPNTTYYLRLKSADPSGNTATDTNGGDGYTLHTVSGPVISNVTTNSIDNTSAVVNWKTDIAADSTVLYSTSPAMTSPTTVTLAPAVTDHYVTLSGLALATRYYFEVQSGVALDPNGGVFYNFMTTSDTTAPTISSIIVAPITDTAAVVTWSTNEKATSQVRYGTVSGSLGTPTPLDSVLNLSHSVTITSLTPGTTYYFTVASSDAANITTTSAEQSFTTLNPLTELVPDHTPPVLSAISVNPITDTQAIVRWTTDERASSQVAYGTVSSTLTQSTTLDPTLTVQHAVLVSGLTTKTKYFFTVTSVDGSTNTTTSDEGTFTTLEKQTSQSDLEKLLAEEKNANTDTIGPILSAIAVDPVTENTATVSWTTNESANSFVQFGPTGVDQLVYGNWVYATDHQLSLTNLQASTEYSYRVVSADAAGNISLSTAASFTTKAIATTSLEAQLQQQIKDIAQIAQALPGPVIGGVPQANVSATTATISWLTDKPATSQVAFAADTEFAGTTYTQTVGQTETLTQEHSVKISNLSPDTLYHYQIRSTSAIGQLASTNDGTFRTLKKIFAIENYSADTPDESTAVFRWTTSDLASATVQIVPYRNNVRAVDELKTVVDDTQTFIHQLKISDVEPSTRYNVEIISVDAAGHRVSKTIDNFTTSKTLVPPVISNVRVDSALSPGEKVKVQTIVSWSTNVPASSQVYYREGVGKADETLTEKTDLDANATKRHIVVITSFHPGAVYQLRVESKDSNGQVTTSKALTMLTPQQERTVFQVISNTFTQVFGWTKVFNQ